MRMRNGDADQAAKAFDEGDCGLVEQRDAVPQDVAFIGHHQKRALGDSEGGYRADTDEPRLVLLETVHGPACERLVRGPDLARRRHKLARLVTDLTALRLLRRSRELGAAGDADKGGHDRAQRRARDAFRKRTPRPVVIALASA